MLIRRRLASGLMIALLAGLAVQPAAAQRGLEYEVKAAFIYNFIKFVEWPADALAEGEPFRVCLAGEDPFGGAVERTVRGDTIGGHAITVERSALDAVSPSCDLVFVPRAHAGRTAAIVKALEGAPALLVGESDGFLQAGGAIDLVVEGGHVRFDIAENHAAAHGLRISSKLLRVARNTGTHERQDH